ncbi:MAG: hypothetical protein KDA63_12245 [Planctomycetales bacterium]|nr:hypothetical protein [Planctomycetales bacterium]
MSSRRAIESAKQVLALCSATDPWFPKPSQATVLAWAEHIDRTNFARDELLEAVRTFYSAGGDCRPRPGDIINAAKSTRNDRFMRQPLEAIYAHRDAIDERLAGRIEETADTLSLDRAIETKYRRPDMNPLTVPCPYDGCRAIPGKRCTSARQPMNGYHPTRIDAAKAGRHLPPGGTA